MSNDKNLREQQQLRRRIRKRLGESGIKFEIQKELRVLNLDIALKGFMATFSECFFYVENRNTYGRNERKVCVPFL
jgi:hypothetical protein